MEDSMGVTQKYTGIGGFMIPTALYILFWLLNPLRSFFYGEYTILWRHDLDFLNDPSSIFYSPNLIFWTKFEFIVNTVVVIFSLYLLKILLQKKSSFKKVGTLFFIFISAYMVVHAYANQSMSRTKLPDNAIYISMAFFLCLNALVVIYFLKSKRVSQTFIN